MSTGEIDNKRKDYSTAFGSTKLYAAFSAEALSEREEEHLAWGATGSYPRWYQLPAEAPTGVTYTSVSGEPSTQLVIQLSSEIRTLIEEVRELRSDLQGRPHTSSILLSNLSDEGLSVLSPISIILEEYDDECLARWPEVNAYGLGSTLHEAIVYLKKNIAELFYDLTSRNEETLGELAIETLTLLNFYIKNN